MKNRLFQSFKPLICLIWLYYLSSMTLFGQLTVTNLGNGFVSATISASCPNGTLILNWGDGCENNSTNSTFIHQYLTCGTFTVTLTCAGPGGSNLLASRTVTIAIASVSITTNRTSLVTDCGQDETLQINFSRNGGCSTPAGNVTISGTIPSGFEVIGGNSNGNNVSLIVPAASIPAAPATLTRTLQLRPLPCSNNSDQPTTITLVGIAPSGIGLSNAICNTIISTVPPPLASVDLSWTFTPKAACLNITKTTSTPTIGAGGTAQFQVTVSNTGNANAQNIQVNDVFPSELVPLSLPPNTTVSGNMATTPIAPLGIGGNQVLNYSFKQVPVPCQTSATYKNCATATLLGCNFKTMEACATVNLIAPLPTPNPAFTVTPIDCNTIQFTAVSNTAGQTHFWDFGNSNTSTLANPVNSFANGPFTVTHTITECGVSASAMQTVTINCAPPEPPTCPCSNNNGINIIAFNEGTLYSELEQINNFDVNNDGIIDLSEHNGCITIGGKLIIDQNLTIVDCPNIKMQPCAEIEVRAQSHLTMTQNKITGCVKMWRGITVKPFGWLTFQRNTVEDAQTAIIANGSSFAGFPAPNTIPYTTIEVQKNRFVRNHIGILAKGLPWASLAHQPISGNTFIGNGSQPLLPPCDQSLANWNADNGYAGVVSQAINLSIGSATDVGFTNTFSALRNGVIGENCWLQVHHASFTDMVGEWLTEGQAPTFAASTGVGVVANNGLSTISGSFFNGCGHGIYALSGAISALQNDMPNVRRGIEINSPIGCTLSENKDIVFKNKGIYGRNLQTGPISQYFQYAINKNRVRNFDQSETEDDMAIHMANGNQPDLINARMSENEVFIDAKKNAIRVEGLGRWVIDRNYVQYKPFMGLANSGTGLLLLSSARNYLYGNNMEDIATSPVSTGFNIAISPENTFCCNVTDGHRLAFRFFGACGTTTFRTSDMSAHETCLEISQSGTIGEQGPGDIVSGTFPNFRNWFNTSSGIARHLGNSQGIVNSSRFHVLSTLTSDFPEQISTPNLPTPTNSWFVPNGNGNPNCTSCTEPPLVPDVRPRQIDEGDRLIVGDGFGKETAGERMLQWEGSRNLYRRMQQYPETHGKETAVDAFYKAAASAKIGAYYLADSLVNNLSVLSAATALSMSQYIAQVRQAETDIQAQLKLLVSKTNWADSLAIYRQIDAILAAAAPAVQHFVEQIAIANIERNTRANFALSVVAALPVTDVLEQNRKDVLEIYAQTIGQDNNQLTPEQAATISGIAYQCPEEGGSAVYLARVIYQLVAATSFDDEALCNNKERSSIQASSPTTATYLIAPNPASNQVTIAPIYDEWAANTQIRLSDASGRIWTEVNAPKGSNLAVLDIAKLPIGVYFCHIMPDNGKNTIHKLIINR